MAKGPEVLLPSSAQIRKEANEILETLELRDLATALKNGDRLKSYVPYVEFLKAGDCPAMHLRQLADGILFELRKLRAKDDLKILHDQALRGLME